MRLPPPGTVRPISLMISLIVSGIGFNGCSGSRSRILTPAPDFPAIIRPLDGSVGTVVLVQDRLRFVVLDYSFSAIPQAGTVLELYRASNRVGRVRLSRWNNATTAAADVLEGSPQMGDTARPD